MTTSKNAKKTPNHSSNENQQDGTATTQHAATDTATEKASGTDTGKLTADTAAVETTVAASAKAAEETVAMTRQKMEEAMNTTQEAYTKSIDDSLNTAKDQLAKSGEKWTRGWEEASQSGQDALKALTDSNTALMKGAEDVAKIWFTVSQSVMEQSVKTARSMMTASSLSEVVDLQSAHAKNTFDTMVAEMTRMSELSLKSANEAMGPLNDRVNDAMVRMTKPMAA